jgi:hypothetical protein
LGSFHEIPELEVAPQEAAHARVMEEDPTLHELEFLTLLAEVEAAHRDGRAYHLRDLLIITIRTQDWLRFTYVLR